MTSDNETVAQILTAAMNADELQTGNDPAVLRSAIVAALEAARRSVTDAAKGSIIDCTGEVPCLRRVLGTFVLTEDGCVWAHGAKVYWRDDPHEESIENINDDIAFFEDHGTDATGEVCGAWEKVSECYGTPEAAKAAMEGRT